MRLVSWASPAPRLPRGAALQLDAVRLEDGPPHLVQIGQRFVVVRDCPNLVGLRLRQVALEGEDVEGGGDAGLQPAPLYPKLLLRQRPGRPSRIHPLGIRLQPPDSLPDLLDDL